MIIVLRAVGQSSQLRVIGRCHSLMCQDLRLCNYLSLQSINVWDYVQQLIDMDLWAKWSPVNRLNIRQEWSLMLEVFKIWLDNPSCLGVRTPNAVRPCGGKNPSTFGARRILSWFDRTIQMSYILVGHCVWGGKEHVKGPPQNHLGSSSLHVWRALPISLALAVTPCDFDIVRREESG